MDHVYLFLRAWQLPKVTAENENDLVARGILSHRVLVGQASCLSHLIDGLEAHPTILHHSPILID